MARSIYTAREHCRKVLVKNILSATHRVADSICIPTLFVDLVFETFTRFEHRNNGIIAAGMSCMRSGLECFDKHSYYYLNTGISTSVSSS